MPDDTLTIAQKAGQVPQQSDSTTPVQQPQWVQAISNMAPYAVMGAAGSRGGMGGILGSAAAAAAVKAFMDYQKRHKLAAAARTANPMATSSPSAGYDDENYGVTGAPDLSTPDVAQQPDYSGEYKAGGKIQGRKLNKRGEAAMKKMTKKSVGGAIGAVDAARALDRMPHLSTYVGRVAPFRAHGTGRFAKGGLLDAMGTAKKGKKFAGEF